MRFGVAWRSPRSAPLISRLIEHAVRGDRPHLIRGRAAHQPPSWSFPILQAHQSRTGRGLKRRDHGKQLAYLGRDRRAIFNANATQGPRKAASPLIALSALVSRAKLLRVNSSSARSSPHPSVKYTVVLPNATHGTVDSSLQAAFSWRWRDVQTGPGASFAISRPCHLLDTTAIDSYAHRAHYRWVSKYRELTSTFVQACTCERMEWRSLTVVLYFSFCFREMPSVTVLLSCLIKIYVLSRVDRQ